jgi:hypothetical protein
MTGPCLEYVRCAGRMAIRRNLLNGGLEAAHRTASACGITPDCSDFDPVLENLGNAARKDDPVAVRRLERLRNSLEIWRDEGFFPQKMIPAVDLHEGYNGKILLAQVESGIIGRKIVLRSRDLWHREILVALETEIRERGFSEASVFEMGGAWVRSLPDGAVEIFGASDDFGACDKEFAAELIRSAFPGKSVRVGE